MAWTSLVKSVERGRNKSALGLDQDEKCRSYAELDDDFDNKAFSPAVSYSYLSAFQSFTHSLL